MFEAIIEGFTLLLDPVTFGLLFLGTALGMFVGITPGVGGTVSLAILLPVIWGMPPAHALPLMIGILAVGNTTESIPAVILGTPLEPGAAATALDGYPMTKRGEAGRALGAVFCASMLGGILGAIALTLSVPIAWPLIRQFLSPEFFMLCLLGVVLVGGLTGQAPLKGLFAGGLGLMLSVVGGAPGVGHYRFTFDLPYLYDGIPLVVLALGLMGVPEMVDLFMKGTQVAEFPKLAVGKGVWQGYKDTFKNWWLVIRSSAIGAYIGFAPGIGGSAAVWLAYSHAVASEKNGRFGKGDVRGVIAPESANNAVRGGSLIPTLLFGIPGTGAMALFLMAMLIIGINPGPDMLTKNLPLLYNIAWSLVIANVVAALVATVLAGPIARLSIIKIHTLIPFVLLLLIMGAFQATRNWGDLLGLFMFAALGWTMKHLGWPRPPLLIGFVLGGFADKYLWLSVSIFGLSWLWRPWVLGILAATVVSLIFIMRRRQEPEKVVVVEDGTE